MILTHSFDTLAGIRYAICTGPFRSKLDASEAKVKIADWLADICVEQAGRHEEDWNFDSWKEGPRSKLHKSKPELVKKFEFLDDTHSVLDHGDYHLEVFERGTENLIRVIHDLLVKGETPKRSYRRAADDFEDLEEALDGHVENKNCRVVFKEVRTQND